MPDRERARLDAYARRTAGELVEISFRKSTLDLFSEDWGIERSGLFGRSKQTKLVRTDNSVRPGWELEWTTYQHKQIYDMGSRHNRRGPMAHDITTSCRVWLTESGELWTFFVSDELVLGSVHGSRRINSIASEPESAPSADWQLEIFDCWPRLRRSFTSRMMDEETLSNGRRRFPHRFQGVSTALTSLRKAAGTYVSPAGR